MFHLPTEFVTSHNELDTILVKQHDEIIEMIDRGDVNEALATLRILRPMWARLTYEYKYFELVNRALRKNEEIAIAS